MKIKKMFLKTNNNNKENISPFIQKIRQKNAIKKIQKFYRNYIRLKKEQIEKEKILQKEKEESPFLKMNLDMVETVFSSNSLINLNISKDNIINNNNDKTIIKNNSNSIPFNIKNKLSNMHCKYSGYLKKKSRSNKTNNEGNNINLSEEKEIFDNEESLIKEGFGKFIFNDGTEFFGIFHNNIFQNYGKYLHINHKDSENKNAFKSDNKEILITDSNLNYEEFIGEYKNYIPNGFGIYTNLITNLKIIGIFGENGLYGIGIEKSAEGGYTYYGEF
jgi:hypothetical protein